MVVVLITSKIMQLWPKLYKLVHVAIRIWVVQFSTCFLYLATTGVALIWRSCQPLGVGKGNLRGQNHKSLLVFMNIALKWWHQWLQAYPSEKWFQEKLRTLVTLNPEQTKMWTSRCPTSWCECIKSNSFFSHTQWRINLSDVSLWLYTHSGRVCYFDHCLWPALRITHISISGELKVQH